MSAPLELTADQLRSLAEALEQLSAITAKTGVEFTGYGNLVASIGNSNLDLAHDGERYYVRDRNGD